MIAHQIAANHKEEWHSYARKRVDEDFADLVKSHLTSRITDVHGDYHAQA